MSRSAKKDKLLQVAERLFYEHGFRGVGLKQIISEANVATMTLYNHFPSKDNLVEEVLRQREERYWSYLDSHVELDSDSPFILAVEAHCRWLKEHSYKGDMFLRAIEDYAGTDNDIEKIARGHKHKLLQYFQKLAQRKGKTNEQDLAYQFTLLLEGTTSMTTLIGAEKATEYSIAMARTLVQHTS
ncbi:transcriptional regulator [Bacillus sp. CPSM8]|uniref:TetR/AcrR family transcriptional regulator n=1 Tax=Bacillus TaxID=1386 RepID=UPI0003A72CA8|nr:MULTISPECIES: TetR/AcrR family transcriptional regulator [Bacillus]ETB72871.1 transcriptional regulator [Bacillus sp. CPSM8]MCY1629165.1 TetR/AcrR family transcriptional regulator [Bacillus paralicheniformis]MDR9800822.1 TetR/AcrR family transcriptional regulator [Bacillus paralicheniformis]QSF99613.1 TetR/AcrR family transcriptional regulator [Bacillus paralicheniformis]TWK46014.1 HTH-type transcriptional repressor KstR2 [Bacillus paralicheniformis]